MTATRGARDAVEHEGLADDFRIGIELGDPGFVANHEDGRRAGFVVFCGGRAAEERRDSEGFESAGGDELAVEAFGAFFGGVENVGAGASGDAIEDVILRGVGAEFGGSDSGAGTAVSGLVGVADLHDDEAVGVRVGEGVEQDSVDDGEDGGGGADAEGESENGDGGEAGIFAQHAQSVTKILEESGQEWPPKARRYVLTGYAVVRWASL